MNSDAIEERARLVTLAECPPGPFRFDGKHLGFKTEYGMARVDENGANMPGDRVRWVISNLPDAYVMESGETFWGGAKTHEERSALLVEPIDPAMLALATTEAADGREDGKCLPETAAGHWDSDAGREMAETYLGKARSDLMNGDISDLALANRMFMAGRSDLDLVAWQTAAKERIRWLSAQLAALPLSDRGR